MIKTQRKWLGSMFLKLFFATKIISTFTFFTKKASFYKISVSFALFVGFCIDGKLGKQSFFQNVNIHIRNAILKC